MKNVIVAPMVLAMLQACGGEGREDAVDTGSEPGGPSVVDAVDTQVQDTTAFDDAALDTFTDAGPQCLGEIVSSPLPDDVDQVFARGPYLQSVTTNSAVIVWKTLITEGTGVEAVPGCVEYEAGGVVRESCADPSADGRYEVLLEELPAGSVVAYTARVGDAEESGPFKFATAPAGLEPVRMMVFADGHNNESVLRPLALAALAEGVDIAVGVGDLVDKPREELMDQLLNGLRPLIARVPFWPVLGNHENRGKVYFDAFVVPGAAPDPPTEIYYDVRWGDVWLGILEIVDFDVAYWLGTDDLPQVEWLRERLASPEAREARWRLLFIHQPPWCVGWGHCDEPQYHGEAALREILVPMAVEGGVTAMFSGHMHGYEHGVMDGVHLFITGGAGGGLDHLCDEPEGLPQPWTHAYVHHWLRVDAGCDVMVVDALDLDGGVIDHVEIPFEQDRPGPRNR